MYYQEHCIGFGWRRDIHLLFLKAKTALGMTFRAQNGLAQALCIGRLSWEIGLGTIFRLMHIQTSGRDSARY